MRKSLTHPHYSSLSLYKRIIIFTFSVLFSVGIGAQCPPEVIELPVDVTLALDADCEAAVSWAEPTYSLDCTDFDDSFDPINWTSESNGQNGSVDVTAAPTAVSITGSSDGTAGTNTNTDYCIDIPFDGNINFAWTATAVGGGAQLINDEPAYTIDGVQTLLNINGTPVGTGVSTESGTITDLAVTAGQTFCLRVRSNNQGATTTMDVSAFTFEITQIDQSAGVVNGSIQPEGDYTIEYTVADCLGQESTCSFTVSLTDQTDPVINSPGNIMITQGLSCGVSIDPLFLENETTEGLPSAMDNCAVTVSMAVLSADPNVIDGWDVGEVVTINDLSISYQDVVIEHPDGVCTSTEERKYRILRTWSVVDAAGNMDEVEQRINIGDQNVNPTAVAVATPIEKELDAGCSSTLLATEVNGVSFDNCGINDLLDPSTFDVNTTAEIRLMGSTEPFAASLVLDRSVFNFQTACPATVTIELQVTDECGNTGVTTKDITVRDATTPTITTCVTDVDFEGCDESAIEAPQPAFSLTSTDLADIATFTALGGAFDDNCGVLSISYRDSINQSVAGCPNPNTRILRLFTVVDSCQNTAVCTQTININDAEAPTFDCPANQAANTSDDGTGDCTVVVENIGLSNVTDACTGSMVTITYEITGATALTGLEDASGVAFNAGVSTVTYSVEDCNGNSNVCSFEITITDDESPSIVCDMSFAMDSDPDRCSSVVCYGVEVVENCPPSPPTVLPGFTFIGELNGSTYFVPEAGGELLWEDANTMAAELGGHLVSINSQIEQDFLFSSAPINLYTLGLRYSPSLDAFKWTSGEAVTYTNWGPGQPGNSPLNGDYVFELDINGGPSDGWYNTINILPTSYIIEFEGVQLELLEGLASGSSFPVGNSEVSYRAVDAAGNADTCTFTITVNDVQAPEYDCILTDTIIQLGPEACTIVFTYDEPEFMDNCPDAVSTRIEGLASGEEFPIGTTTITYEVVDTTGNSDQCSFTVDVLDYIPDGLGCIEDLNISLDELTCSGELVPSMLVGVETIGCADSCDISIILADGSKVPAIFDTDDVGNRYQYEICCGGICCWGYVDVEYKYKPVIQCVDTVVLSCVQALDEAIRPMVDSNCADTELVQIGESPQMIDCDDRYTASATRTWVAMDEFGNFSDTCTQVVLFERTDLSSIAFPVHQMLANDMAVSCSAGVALDANGNPDPSVTGTPTLTVDGTVISLYPFTAGAICNGYVTYEDKDIVGANSCVRKIRRTWTVGEWHCTNPEPETYIQVIEIVDFTAPTYASVGDFTVSTDDFDCSATVSLPIPTIVDDCNAANVSLDLGTPVGAIVDYSGENIELPVGVHDIIYNVYDGCGNSTFDTIQVTVVDNADPIAICDQFTVVSIGVDGISYVTAAGIDDGSFDECGEVSLSIARMDDPGFEDFTGFGEEVTVTCADIGAPLMVGLLVTDKGGNTNMCMVSVEVQDKVEARMSCPDAVTVECNLPFDPDNLGAFFGEIEIFDNCPATNTVTDVLVGDLNSCGSGVLTRQIRLFDAAGTQVDFCTQTITFAQGNPLTESEIDWPDADLDYEGCIDDLLDTENFGEPMIAAKDCQQVGMRYEDEVFPFNTNGTCQKVIRTWFVIDWCLPDTAPGGTLNPFTFEQTIKLNNTVDPVFTSVPADTVICSFAVDCGAVAVSDYLIATATDDCTETSDLFMTYEVRTATGTMVQSGAGLDASGVYDIGTYNVLYIVEDKCGNQEIATTSFEVRNCKLPTPYCLNGLSAGLVAMDLDEDGEVDTEMIMLTPDFFDGGSYHTCGYAVQLSFSSDVNDTERTYNCDDLGNNIVELWVTDENGNQDFCITFIDIQDNNDVDFCPEQSNMADVQGRVYTEEEAEVSGVSVALDGGEVADDMTETDGAYDFNDMPEGGSYVVVPTKDDDHRNGVNTIDLITIQRHILGIQPIASPYKMIAADINHDAAIKASDLLALRKLILGVSEDFPTNTSWRFIDEQYTFTDAVGALEESYPEDYAIDALTGNMWVDFIGVKVGDVNGDAVASAQGKKVSESRSGGSIQVTLQDVRVTAESDGRIAVYAAESGNIYGLQYAMAVSRSAQVVDIEPGVLSTDLSSSAMVGDEFRVSHAEGRGVRVEKGDKLFTIVLRSTSTASELASELVSLSESYLSAEAYLGEELAAAALDLVWQQATEEAAEELPSELALLGVAPNPWVTTTAITVSVPTAGEVELRVSDAQGRVVYTASRYLAAGIHELQITAEQVPLYGVLLYDISQGESHINGKMIKID